MFFDFYKDIKTFLKTQSVADEFLKEIKLPREDLIKTINLEQKESKKNV